MSSIFGNNIKVSVFGQSHSAAIGVTVDGLPVGKKIDMEKLQAFLNRRRPGFNKYSTPRKEADVPEIISGLVDNITCGAPLTAIIRNTNTRSGDYAQLSDIPRPAHADYAAHIRYEGYQDVRGGGHFSGRLTAPLCIAGGICRQILEEKNIQVSAHIYSIAGVIDDTFDPCCEDVSAYSIEAKKFPVINEAVGEKMQEIIQEAREAEDSVGGIVECMITGIPAGIGDPMFDGIENRIAAAIFGIPAVKGIEFGKGFESSGIMGSENNDAFYMQNGKVRTKTNNHGGILGGITSGMPIFFKVAFKPTPSISLEQDSISISKEENTKLVITGRHDPCIVPRAVPVVEAVSAIIVQDILAGKSE